MRYICSVWTAHLVSKAKMMAAVAEARIDGADIATMKKSDSITTVQLRLAGCRWPSTPFQASPSEFRQSTDAPRKILWGSGFGLIAGLRRSTYFGRFLFKEHLVPVSEKPTANFAQTTGVPSYDARPMVKWCALRAIHRLFRPMFPSSVVRLRFPFSTDCSWQGTEFPVPS